MCKVTLIAVINFFLFIGYVMSAPPPIDDIIGVQNYSNESKSQEGSTFFETKRIFTLNNSYYDVPFIWSFGFGYRRHIFNNFHTAVSYYLFDGPGSSKSPVGPEPFSYFAQKRIKGSGFGITFSKSISTAIGFPQILFAGVGVGCDYIGFFREEMGPFSGQWDHVYSPYLSPLIGLQHPVSSKYLLSFFLAYYQGFQKFDGRLPQYISWGLRLSHHFEKVPVYTLPKEKSQSRFFFNKNDRRWKIGVEIGSLSLDTPGRVGESIVTFGLCAGLHKPNYIYEISIGRKIGYSFQASFYRYWNFFILHPFVGVGPAFQWDDTRLNPGFSYGVGVMLFKDFFIQLVFQTGYVEYFNELNDKGGQFSVQIIEQVKF